jgi:hypothetical protein
MTVDGFLVNPEILRSLYGYVPQLRGVRIRSVNLNWRGPAMTLRLDLPGFPDVPPREWIDAGVDTVQCQFQFLAVADLSLAEWAPPAVGDVEMVPLGRDRRMRVTATGSGIALECTTSESVRVGHVTAFEAGADGSDGGRHVFLSKVDARRHTSSLPGTDERTFYER